MNLEHMLVINVQELSKHHHRSQQHEKLWIRKPTKSKLVGHGCWNQCWSKPHKMLHNDSIW